MVQGVYPGVTTVELDELAAQTAASCATQHPDFSVLAARISVSNLHKQTPKVFSDVVEVLHKHVHPKTGTAAPLVSDTLYNIVQQNMERLNSAIIYDRDYNYDYFGFKTLERAYLMQVGKKVLERPQHMIMRVAIGIHGEDLDGVLETYVVLCMLCIMLCITCDMYVVICGDYSCTDMSTCPGDSSHMRLPHCTMLARRNPSYLHAFYWP